jgi:DNA replication protein DnaC
MRASICGPSGSGKTILLQNIILDIYKNAFDRIYIFSPSIDIDQSWQPVKSYITEHKMQGKDEKIYFNNYDANELEHIISTQYKVIDYMKQHNHIKLYQILIIIDDFADSPEFTRQSRLLHQLYIRGRHMMISTITATQVFKAISPIIRKNITDMFVFRLRNKSDLDGIIEEVSAIHNPKVLLQLYQMATEEPYSFLYIKLNAKTKQDMFLSV